MSVNSQADGVAQPASEPADLVVDEVDAPAHHDPWSSLEAKVPTLRSPTEVAAFVECVLVELRHEPVAARYRTKQTQGGVETIWCRTEHTGLSVDAEYVQLRDDPRNGVDIEPCSRATVREALCECLDHEELGRVDVQPLAAITLGDQR